MMLRRVIAALTVFVMSISSISAFAEQNTAEPKQTQEGPVWYINQEYQSHFADGSSWDSNIADASVDYQHINLSSATQPIELTRPINPITSGQFNLEFYFQLDRATDDVSFRLLEGRKTAFSIVTKGPGLYLEQPNGELFYLQNYGTVGDNSVKALMDFDTQTILEVYINGQLAAQNKPFANKVSQIDSFDVYASKDAQGKLHVRKLQLYSGYIVNETFMNTDGKHLPADWKVEASGGIAGLYDYGSRFKNVYNLVLNSEGGDVSVSKLLEPVGGCLTFESYILLPQKRTGVGISLKNGNDTILQIGFDNEYFTWTANSKTEQFYKYMANMWYMLKAELDFNNRIAKLYLNGKYKCDVPLGDFSAMDSIAITAMQGAGDVMADNILLYRSEPNRDDYVPEPVPAVSDDFYVGMQMCPLWAEDSPNGGWDKIKATPGREPLLGYYDEYSSELADWEINWMLENGVNFQLLCVYGADGSCSEGTSSNPWRLDNMRSGVKVNAYFNAKYSDMLPFALMLENSFFNPAGQTVEEFFSTELPFYIEYYFKDPRYFKIGGRPILFVYNLDNFYAAVGRTKEEQKVGIARFRQACIDAGVGNPYIAMRGASQYSAEYLKQAKEMGIEGISMYGFGPNETPKLQEEKWQETIYNNSETKLDVIPQFAPTRCDVAWYDPTVSWRGVGFQSEKEDYKELLAWGKNVLMPQAPKKTGEKQIVTLATWDEYGEGHILMPTKLSGFDYLEAVREVFVGDVDETGHKHTLPTKEQKKRINHLVVQDRLPDVMTCIDREKYLPHRAEDAEKPQEVKYSWDFTQMKDFGGWELNEAVSEVKFTDEGLSGVISGSSPTLYIEPEGVNGCDINYVRVRMKTEKKGYDGYAYWDNDADNIPGRDKKRWFSSAPFQANTFCDYDIAVGRFATAWNAPLNSLTLLLGKFDQGQNITIESIELLGDAMDGAVLEIDTGMKFAYKDQPVMEGDALMLPMRETVEYLGAKFGRYRVDDSYSVKTDDTFGMVSNGVSTAQINNESMTLQVAPHEKNGTFYVPSEFLAEALGVELNYDAKTKTISVVTGTKEDDIKGVPRLVVHEYDFGKIGDSMWVGNGKNKKIENGMLSVEAEEPGYDLQMTLPDVNFNASDIKTVVVGMQSSTTDTNTQLFFTTDTQSGLSEDKSQKITVHPSKKIVDYEFDISNNPLWDGTITGLRFDPIQSEGNVKIAYMRLLGDIDYAAMQALNNQFCIKWDENTVMWNFERNSTLNGWSANKHLGNVTFKRGLFSAEVMGASPAFRTNSGLNIDASYASNIHIRFNNDTDATSMRLYAVKTDNTEEYVDIPIKPRNALGSTYSVKTNWSGTISSLRLELAGSRGNVGLRSVILAKDGGVE